ncbi:MAG: hypothetical protein BalsKO_31210 [Balneolaceae bacterium]
MSFAQNSDLIGKTTAEDVRQQHRVFDIYTKRYAPNSESLTYLSEIQDSVHIFVLFGTWCHDSKKQIPAFMKTIELANNSNISVEYTAVSRKKKEPKEIVERWNLKLTPTFIIYREGREFGRIVEEPTQSMEQDLVSILKSEPISDR